MTLHPDEQARELAEWLHEKLCCAQNLPWEEGDICDDCVESVRAEVLPLLARVRLEAQIEELEREWPSIPRDGSYLTLLQWIQGLGLLQKERIASLRQAAGERTKP